jgi:hypothetical protein
MDIEQITKADRNACHALHRKGKACTTLRRLSTTVLFPFIIRLNKVAKGNPEY